MYQVQNRPHVLEKPNPTLLRPKLQPADLPNPVSEVRTCSNRIPLCYLSISLLIQHVGFLAAFSQKGWMLCSSPHVSTCLPDILPNDFTLVLVDVLDGLLLELLNWFVF